MQQALTRLQIKGYTSQPTLNKKENSALYFLQNLFQKAPLNKHVKKDDNSSFFYFIYIEYKEVFLLADIFISPAPERFDKGIMGFGSVERRMNIIADALEIELNRLGISSQRAPSGCAVFEAVAMSNANLPKAHVALYSFSSDSSKSGFEIYHNQPHENGERLASDIADACQRINADHVFVFPNNKNIILAAEQAKSLVENRTIHVIPTKNIPQGFAAAMAFNPEISIEENKTNMFHALDSVTVGQVTYAVKNTKVNGFDIKVNDVIGLDNKNILAKGQNIEQVVLKMIEKLRGGEEIITLYYGSDVKEEDAEALQAKVQETYPDCDVQLNYGGQPIYYYYISLE
jgi:hypothetical protein